MNDSNSPEFTIIMPCYNEEKELPDSIPPLLKELDIHAISYEMILVNNGSGDSTKEIIDGFIRDNNRIRILDYEKNLGYGGAIREAIKIARGTLICHMCSDGQVHADDVLRVLLLAQKQQRGTVVKIRRYTRGDGLLRKIISTLWNVSFLLTFGDLTSDVNGVPKVTHRDDLALLDLHANDAFLEAEYMVKVLYLNFNVLSVSVNFMPRSKGRSKINLLKYSGEFLKNMMRYKFSPIIKQWKADVQPSRLAHNHP